METRQPRTASEPLLPPIMHLYGSYLGSLPSLASSAGFTLGPLLPHVDNIPYKAWLYLTSSLCGARSHAWQLSICL